MKAGSRRSGDINLSMVYVYSASVIVNSGYITCVVYSLFPDPRLGECRYNAVCDFENGDYNLIRHHSLSLTLTAVTTITVLVTPPSHHHITSCTRRLVSARHVTQSKDYENLLAEKEKSGFTDVEVIRTGKKMFEDPGERYRIRERAKKWNRLTAAGNPVASSSTRSRVNGVAPLFKAPLSASLVTKSEGVVGNEKGSQTDFHETPTMEITPAGAGGSPQITWNRDMEGVLVPSQSPGSEASVNNTLPSLSPVPKSECSAIKKSTRERLTLRTCI